MVQREASNRAARLMERTDFRAHQASGFALDGAYYGFPDIDLTHFGEKSAVVMQIIGERALADLHAGRPMPAWADIEDAFD